MLGYRSVRHAEEPGLAINAVCPYFTMFPLDFPIRVLRSHGSPGEWVFDPFCGRGTTLMAARYFGLGCLGVDSSPIATAIAEAKLRKVSPKHVLSAAENILASGPSSKVPKGRFWTLAFHSETLGNVVTLRNALLNDCRSQSRKVLRAILLGALHGPRNKLAPSYFSNQSPRTYAPKPAYALRFWKDRGLRPQKIDVFEIIKKRVAWYLSEQLPSGEGWVVTSDSRSFDPSSLQNKFQWVITSPPYYGMRTYLPDQWLRHWFLGGPPSISYARPPEELDHGDPKAFEDQLRMVWSAAAQVASKRARLVCRFGGIYDRAANPREILLSSFSDTPWKVVTLRDAGSAQDGKRQADQFGFSGPSKMEFDLYARTT